MQATTAPDKWSQKNRGIGGASFPFGNLLGSAPSHRPKSRLGHGRDDTSRQLAVMVSEWKSRTRRRAAGITVGDVEAEKGALVA